LMGRERNERRGGGKHVQRGGRIWFLGRDGSFVEALPDLMRQEPERTSIHPRSGTCETYKRVMCLSAVRRSDVQNDFSGDGAGTGK
jgi:hypothetical protein